MKKPIAAQLQQVHLGLSLGGYEPVAHHKADKTAYAREHEALKAHLLRICPASVWPNGIYNAACPRPILVSRQHQQQLADLHDALAAAVTDIVPRWWTDREARFPERMPLERGEEELLQWLEGQVSLGNLPHYPACRGSWRPDFLVEDYTSDEDGRTVENFRITEINGRFSFNAFVIGTCGHQALNDMGVEAYGLTCATDPAELLDGLFSLFSHDVPLHLLKGEEHGLDIHMFIDMAQRRFGITPRLITPADLRLLPDPQSETGYKLCCLATKSPLSMSSSYSALITTSEGEMVEEIHRVGLELHQRELHALDPEMLRQISLRCFNDMRTILLVHDKRMLGIVKQELQSLVARKVLTPAQAEVLDRGIADTILAGSQEMDRFVQLSKTSPERRRDYLLKPVRSGKGAGIVFGDDCSPDEWVSALERLRSPELIPGVSCVVQRRIVPKLYDVVLKASGERLRYPLIGTYFVINGKLLGLGGWRSSNDRICAVSHGGAWICSVTRQG